MYEPDLQKNIMSKDENCKFGDFWYLHVCSCSIVKCKCLWRGRFVMDIFANNFEYSPKSEFMTYFRVKP